MDELVHGSRLIVTNVPLKLGEVNQYLQTRHPKAFERYFEFKTGDESVAVAEPVAHITDRIILIDEDEMSKFFTFRGNGVRLRSVTNDEWREGKRPDYSVVKDGGVFYVLDEIHIAFNSRAWALTGNEVLYYLSQHRKLGDDVVCITQSVNNVDKQFRSVAQDYTYIKNLSKQRVGLFRLPSMFMRSTYAGPATPTTAPMESGAFRLDVSGLAACYDTAKGVGIHGRAGADTHERKRGISWLWMVIGLPVVAWLILHWLPLILARHLAYKVPPRPVPVATHNLPVSVSPVLVVTQFVQASAPSLATPTNQTASTADAAPATSLYCVGYGGSGNSWKVILSDGSVVSSASGRLTKITEDYVVVDRKKIPIHAPPPPPPAKSVPGSGVLNPAAVEPLDSNVRYIPVPMERTP